MTSRKKPTTQKTKKRSSVPLYVGGGILALLLIAFITTGLDDSNTGTSAAQESGNVTVTGTALPGTPDEGAADTAIGMAMPEIQGEDFEGNPVSITNDGRPKAIILLAHWCPHCQNEVAAITSYLETNQFPTNVDVYAVSTSVDKSSENYPPSAWLADAGWPFPTVADDAAQSAARAFGLRFFPTTVFVDSSGTVVLRITGELPTDNLLAIFSQLS